MLPTSTASTYKPTRRQKKSKNNRCAASLCVCIFILIVILIAAYIKFMLWIFRSQDDESGFGLMQEDVALPIPQPQPIPIPQQQQQQQQPISPQPIEQPSVDIIELLEKATKELEPCPLPPAPKGKLVYQPNLDTSPVLIPPKMIDTSKLEKVKESVRVANEQSAKQDLIKEAKLLNALVERVGQNESPPSEKYDIDALLGLGYSTSSEDSFQLSSFNDMKQAMKAYTAFHKKMSSLVDTENSKNVPILVVTPREGWGNMVRAIGSSLYVAMITGRVMYINADWDRYFQPGSQNPNWQLPNSDLLQTCFTYRIDNCKMCERDRELMRVVPFKKLLRESARCINIVAYSPIQEWLLENPTTKGIIGGMLSEDNWQIVYRSLNMHTPSQLIEDKIAPVSAHFKGNHVFGFQIRTGLVDMRGQRRDVRFIKAEIAARMLLCAKRLVSYSKTENIRIFLTTDHPGVTDIFKHEFERIGQSVPTLLHMPFTDEYMEHSMNNPNNLENVIAEWVLLSKTTTIFGSFMSSFVETCRLVNRVPVYWISSPMQVSINSSPFYTSVPPICANLFPYIPSMG